MGSMEIFKFVVVLVSSILLAGYITSYSERDVFAKFGLFIVLSFCIFLVVSITAVLLLYKPL